MKKINLLTGNLFGGLYRCGPKTALTILVVISAFSLNSCGDRPTGATLDGQHQSPPIEEKRPHKNLTNEELIKLANKLYSDGETASKVIAALEKKVDDLKPSLKGDSQEQSIQVAENIINLTSQAKDKLIEQTQILEKLLTIAEEIALRGEVSKEDAMEEEKRLKTMLAAISDEVKGKSDLLVRLNDALSSMYAAHTTRQNTYPLANGRMSDEDRFSMEQQHMQTEAGLKSLNERLESLPTYATATRNALERERNLYQEQSNFEKNQLGSR